MIRELIFDHCSLSWSCDEIFGIVQNQNVTVQWCIISEPLGDPDALIHPYGTNHAYGLNCSATTLSIHHNLIAKYVMRGPQFEANDAVSGQGYEVWKEAVNNVLFDYWNSGSRYRTGVEEGAGNIPFRFHFIKNFYLRSPARTSARDIEADRNYGVTNTIKVHVSGNIGPNRPNDAMDQWSLVMLSDRTPIRSAPADIQAQMSDVPLFTPPVPVTAHSASNAYKQVVSLAGYNTVRDAVDLRVISNVVNRTFTSYPHSQSEVGRLANPQHLQRSHRHRPRRHAGLLGDLPRPEPLRGQPQPHQHRRLHRPGALSQLARRLACRLLQGRFRGRQLRELHRGHGQQRNLHGIQSNQRHRFPAR